ncbi:MAG: carbohydrate ABC transporter permease [Clostridia bacterium]|nr:carbohydrate ABC transporter permease [Clostridia bacterium]
MDKKVKKKKVNVFAIAIAVLLALYMLSMVVSLFWVLMTTVKDAGEYKYGAAFFEGGLVKSNTIWFPKMGITFENYVIAFQNFVLEGDGEGPQKSYNIFAQFVNSFLYSGGCALTVTLSSCVMGYATARFKFRLSNIIYSFVLISLALPIVGAMPSEIAVADSLGIFDTFPGIWIMRASFLNTYFLIFYAQFKMIPKDYTEAAKIDGASSFGVMVKIIFPLAMGTITTVFVLAFIFYWNDFQIPMVYLPSYPVAALGMYQFSVLTDPDEINHIPVRLAGICLMALPIVVFYGIFNRKLNVNLSVGGIKG